MNPWTVIEVDGGKFRIKKGEVTTAALFDIIAFDGKTVCTNINPTAVSALIHTLFNTLPENEKTRLKDNLLLGEITEVATELARKNGVDDPNRTKASLKQRFPYVSERELDVVLDKAVNAVIDEIVEKKTAQIRELVAKKR